MHQELHIKRDKRFTYIAGNQWFTGLSTFIQIKTLKSLTNTESRTIFMIFFYLWFRRCSFTTNFVVCKPASNTLVRPHPAIAIVSMTGEVDELLEEPVVPIVLCFRCGSCAGFQMWNVQLCMASLGDRSIDCDGCNSRYHPTHVFFVMLPDSIINTIKEKLWYGYQLLLYFL